MGVIEKLFVTMIGFYQVTISPWLGRCCRFSPSCSQYAKDAIEKKGFVTGLWYSFFRLIRCHPFHPGGYDPVE